MKQSIVILFLLSCFVLFNVSDGCALPKEGKYFAKGTDNSTLIIDLVSQDGNIRIRDVGYHLLRLNSNVDHLYFEDHAPFGDIKGDKLFFQIPVIHKCQQQACFISKEKASCSSANIAFYQVEISLSNNNKVSCVMTLIDKPNKKYDGMFMAEDVIVGLCRANLMERMSFILRPMKAGDKHQAIDVL